MYTERQAIQDELHDNRRQIKELRDRNGDLLKRLREIDERDMKDNTSFDALNSLTESLTEIIGKMGDLIPHVPAQSIIEHIANQVDPGMVEAAAAKDPQPTKIEKQATQAKLHIQPNNKMISKERTASTIKEIIGEFGVIKVSKLEQEFYKRTGRKYANFSEQIKQAMEISPMIEKAGFGKYKLKERNDDKPLFEIPEENEDAVLS